MTDEVYRPDLSLKGKLRRRAARLRHRRPATGRPARPMVTFAFDDAPESAITVGREILERRGLSGAYFIAAGLAGLDGHMGRYASREQIVAAAGAGHEIACHTYSHLDCGQADGASIEADIERNLATLSQWGVPRPATFAYPYGDVGAPAKKAAAQRFVLSRGLHAGLVDRGSDLNQAPAVGIEGDDGERLALEWMTRVRRQGGWLILFTHGVEPRPTEFGASIDGLSRLADAALTQGLDVVTVAQGARIMQARS